MLVSVILNTYNSPAWLEKVIWGYVLQSHRDFELIIADDGSTAETTLLLRRLETQTKLPIHHVWHADHGFRKCTILNKAIEASSGDYLIFSDGDCIPRWDFVSQHVMLAEPRHLLSGGCVRLPMDLSRRIGVDDVLNRRATNPRWLKAHGLRGKKCLLRLTREPLLAPLMDALTTTRATWNGCNASTWKEHILEVNGFDERMQYGGLDRELGQRLVNAGIRPKQVRHRTVCVHLDHARPYVREEALRINLSMRRETRRKKLVWTPYGVRKGYSLPIRRAA